MDDKEIGKMISEAFLAGETKRKKRDRPPIYSISVVEGMQYVNTPNLDGPRKASPAVKAKRKARRSLKRRIAIAGLTARQEAHEQIRARRKEKTKARRACSQ